MISVIIPIYNRANYIIDCIDSVLQQTYKDLEIIVVDDGSTDNLKEVLSKYGDRIIYIHKENGGVSSARNEGIRRCKGEYIAWLDSDDRWMPFKLELELGILSRLPENVAFIYSDFACSCGANGKESQSYIREYFFTMNTYKLEFGTMFRNNSNASEINTSLKPLLRYDPQVYWGDVSEKAMLGPLFLLSSELIRKSVVDEVGYFNEQYQTGEDYEYHIRIAKKYEIAYVDVPTLMYRRYHADQLSSANMELESNRSWLRTTIELGVNDKAYYSKNKGIVDKRMAHIYYGLGLAQFKRKDFQNAVGSFSRSIKIKPSQRKVYLYLILAAANSLFAGIFG